MIIRSQQKRAIINLDNISAVFIDEVEFTDTKEKVFSILADKIILGTYFTEEKAIKVLDMIQDAYREMDDTFNMPQDSEVQP